MTTFTASTPTILSEWQAYRHDYLARRRLALEARLGACCAACGLSREEGVNLEFHHPKGRGYSARKLSWAQRLSRYAREIDQGLVVLLCDRTGNNCHDLADHHRLELAWNEHAGKWMVPVRVEGEQPF